MKVFNFTVQSLDKGKRMDIFLLENMPKISRSQIKNACDLGGIKVNGKIKKAGYSLRAGDELEVVFPKPKILSLMPEDIPLDIIYEDLHFAVINKAKGMVVHPACGNESGTLVNAILFNIDKLSTINDDFRPGIVHRLDKDTSGLIIVAKNNFAHQKLSDALSKRRIKRYYLALVDGNIKEDSGIISAPIGRSKKDRKLMAVVDDGRSAETQFKVLERFGRYTLVEFELITGRTHQIRVHSKHIKHSIVGDEAYSGSNWFGVSGQLLHSYRLIFTHPATNEIMEFKAPLPNFFSDVLEKLQKNILKE